MPQRHKNTKFHKDFFVFLYDFEPSWQFFRVSFDYLEVPVNESEGIQIALERGHINPQAF